MSNTVRRTKYREVDPMTIDLKKEIEKIELEEALLEAEDIYSEDDEDNPYGLSDFQVMEDSYNPRG